MNEPLNLSQFTRLRESLTIGDVVSVAFTISRERWKQNAGIALQATAWLFVPLIGGGVLSALFMPLMRSAGRTAAGRSGASGIIVLAFVVWLVGALYCLGRYMANSALIARLTFNDLAQQPESLAEARRYTQSRTWSYLGASLLMGLLYSAVFIAVTIAFSIGVVLIAIALGVSTSSFGSGVSNNPVIGFFLVIGILLAFLGFLVGLTWLGSRFFFYEVPMSVERETGAASSIGRTWSLGNRSNWRLMIITTLAYLITLPIQAIAQVVILVCLLIPQLAMSQNASLSGGLMAISVLVQLLVNFVVVVITIVFWQAVKAVVYFDLRNQAEGMGLELRSENE